MWFTLLPMTNCKSGLSPTFRFPTKLRWEKHLNISEEKSCRKFGRIFPIFRRYLFCKEQWRSNLGTMNTYLRFTISLNAYQKAKERNIVCNTFFHMVKLFNCGQGKWTDKVRVKFALGLWKVTSFRRVERFECKCQVLSYILQWIMHFKHLLAHLSDFPGQKLQLVIDFVNVTFLTLPRGFFWKYLTIIGDQLFN